ncbi:molybdate ABC transporter permease subunit [Arhodomonas sp. AD133]|uniref:molybdate ABC transporter permease subunit n=1 Tax=Arhodomonas sp. AD133 TaxID=3415009 RepID=UPI003EB90751
MTGADFIALRLTLALAASTVVILLLVGTPLAWWLAHTRSRWRTLVEATVALPLVLPPTVLGFYLLLLLGPHGPVGGVLVALGGAPLAFTFEGLVFGSVIYSLPFVVQPLQNGFAAVGRGPLEAAATLGAGRWDRFFTVAVPLAGRGFLTAVTLGFAHTVGEFGVVLMIGGNIPGETQVVSIAIYDHVEALDYAHAHALSALLLVLSFALLCAVYWANRRIQTFGP